MRIRHWDVFCHDEESGHDLIERPLVSTMSALAATQLAVFRDGSG
jgi:hypothetical protein